MTVKRGRKLANVREIYIVNHKFEGVDNFKYSGLVINNRNDRNRETEHKIEAVNRTYYK